MEDNPIFPANYHRCLTYELINQSFVSIDAKSVGDKYGFTQELFNVLQQIDEFFYFHSLHLSAPLLMLKADYTCKHTC